jgi:hypothetical protein
MDARAPSSYAEKRGVLETIGRLSRLTWSTKIDIFCLARAKVGFGSCVMSGAPATNAGAQVWILSRHLGSLFV